MSTKFNRFSPVQKIFAANSDARLSAYAMAAAASAAMGSSATAATIYSGLQNISISPSTFIDLNLDGFGSGDIKLKNYVFGGGPYQGATVDFAPGQLVGFTSGALKYVTKLSGGDTVGPGTVGPSFFGSLAYGAHNPSAQFNLVPDGFIGLSFPGQSATYYAWIRVDINNATGLFVVKDWAYANDGSAIVIPTIPESSSLGLLALGAIGLDYYRKRRKSAATRKQ